MKRSEKFLCENVDGSLFESEKNTLSSLPFCMRIGNTIVIKHRFPVKTIAWNVLKKMKSV